MTTPDQPDSVETGDLDGHTLEQLSDYLDRDRQPSDPSIDNSAPSQIALAGLERLRATMDTLLEEDVRSQPDRDDSWVGAILGGIMLEARAGRDIPVWHPLPTARLTLTEGAVRGMLRAAGDTVENIVVGRCRLDGDVTVPGAPITIRVDASVYRGENIPAIANRLRDAMYAAVRMHTDLTVQSIDVTVRDLYLTKPHGEAEADVTNPET